MTVVAPPRYSVVIPVYRNSETIDSLVEQLQRVSSSLPGEMEVLFVVDGSPDDSAGRLLECLTTVTFRASVLELSRNFGSFSAIRIGMSEARGDFVAVIAADLQEPPHLLEDFFLALEGDCLDVVVGRRVGRDDPVLSALASRTYWSLYRRLVNESIPAGGVDVFACTREVARRLAAFTESNTSLIGLLYWAGYRRGFVDYMRRARPAGRSGWTMAKKLRYLSDSVYSFTDLPVVILQIVGVAGIVTSVLVGLLVIAVYLAGMVEVPGYAPLMLVMTGSTSLLLLGMGILGSYVWRAYENTKARPIALIMERHEHGKEVPGGG